MESEYQQLTNILFGLEGNKYDPYVPIDKDTKKAIENSGVTIGKGFDLGAQNVRSLTNMGMPKNIVDKLVNSGYLGVKGQNAIDKLKKHTLRLSKEDVDQINSVVIPYYKRSFESSLKEATGLDANKDLAPHQRLALTSAYFNLGRGLFYDPDTNEKTNFSGQLAKKEWEGAADNLATWSKKAPRGLKARRYAEAQLFSGNIAPSDVVSFKDRMLLVAENGDADMPSMEQYVVKEGDTLYNIAKQTGVPVSKIVDQNKITNPDQIRPGQSLNI